MSHRHPPHKPPCNWTPFLPGNRTGDHARVRGIHRGAFRDSGGAGGDGGGEGGDGGRIVSNGGAGGGIGGWDGGENVA